MFDHEPEHALATGQSHSWEIELSDDARDYPLRITLVWTDPPGNPVASIKLVNDLDLIVEDLDAEERAVAGHVARRPRLLWKVLDIPGLLYVVTGAIGVALLVAPEAPFDRRRTGVSYNPTFVAAADLASAKPGISRNRERLVRVVGPRSGRLVIRPSAVGGDYPLWMRGIYRSARGEAVVQAVYDAATEARGVPVEHQAVSTRFGATHLLVAGPVDARPLVVLSGGNVPQSAVVALVRAEPAALPRVRA
jgi:hypothetical protein